MKFKVSPEHTLGNVRHVYSPNFDARPPNVRISLIVIHAIALPPEEFGSGAIEALFTNTINVCQYSSLASLQKTRVSSHLLITRDGTPTQFVAFDKRAWHAGESSYQGQSDCNDFSIGIELEGTDSIPFTQPQYGTLSDVVVALRTEYPHIPLAGIVGHQEIAPDRKWDPGPYFDWQKFMSLIMNQPP